MDFFLYFKNKVKVTIYLETVKKYVIIGNAT